MTFPQEVMKEIAVLDAESVELLERIKTLP
jgi:hypothetical protein